LRERALPDLGENIKCGNSLIGPDYFAGQLLPDEEEMRRVNPFDWEKEFPEIMEAGGFDAVIGNPPWLMAGYYMTHGTLAYLRHEFRSATGKFDLYYPFVERGWGLLSPDGYLGMIVPNKFFHTKAGARLRSLLSEGRWVRRIVDFGSDKVFTGATNYSCILILQKRPGQKPSYVRARTGLRVVRQFELPWSVLSSATWHFEDERARGVFERLEETGEPLEMLVKRFGTGVQSGADRILTVTPDAAQARHLEPALLRPVLRGRDVRRYRVSEDTRLLVFPYRVSDGQFVILPESDLRQYHNVHDLLLREREKLGRRTWFGKGATALSGAWYGMMYLDSYSSFALHHILTPSLSNRSNFAPGTGALFATGTAGVTSVIPREDTEEDILYLLGVLNSGLISFYAVSHSPVFSGGYYKFSSAYLKKLPIRRIEFHDQDDVDRHDKMVWLVQRMLDLRKKLAAATVPADKKLYQRQIGATDAEIDALVYELYGLTEEEIGIVEGREH
jgi:hypothetical protein